MTGKNFCYPTATRHVATAELLPVTDYHKNAKRSGLSIPEVLAHELGGHTTTILDAAERPIPGSTFPSLDISGLDPKYDEPGARKAQEIGKVPTKPSPEALEAVKRILDIGN